MVTNKNKNSEFSTAVCSLSFQLKFEIFGFVLVQGNWIFEELDFFKFIIAFASVYNGLEFDPEISML